MSVQINEFREFLGSELQRRKKKNPQYSLRAFARTLHLSPAQLSQILSGKRNVTMKVVDLICERLALSPRQKRKLVLDSLFQSTQVAERYHDLKEDEFRLISEWYHMAILSLTRVPNANCDPSWIANRLGISKQNASDALYRLKRLGIIEQGPQLKQIGDPIRVVSEVPSPAIRTYHKQILDISHRAIDEVDIQHRDLSSVSILLNPEQIKKISSMIEEFQNQITDTMEDKKNGEVYFLNVQLVPVVTSKKQIKNTSETL